MSAKSGDAPRQRKSSANFESGTARQERDSRRIRMSKEDHRRCDQRGARHYTIPLRRYIALWRLPLRWPVRLLMRTPSEQQYTALRSSPSHVHVHVHVLYMYTRLHPLATPAHDELADPDSALNQMRFKQFPLNATAQWEHRLESLDCPAQRRE